MLRHFNIPLSLFNDLFFVVVLLYVFLTRVQCRPWSSRLFWRYNLPEMSPWEFCIVFFTVGDEVVSSHSSFLTPSHSCLTGCNVSTTSTRTATRVAAHTHVDTSGRDTILSSAGCKCGFPAGDPGNRQQTNGADLQRRRMAIILQEIGSGKKNCRFSFCFINEDMSTD